jgi:tRNA-specific 2-thiouridylase
MNLKADFVATGHYCQKDEIVGGDGKTTYRLLAGADPNKDQSYFLCQLSQDQLAKSLFPIGHLQKPQVREIAKEIGLPTAEKKDSQGLCFIGKVKLPTFLQQQLQPKKGVVIEVPASEELFPVYRKNPVSIEEVKEACAPYSFSKEMGKKVGDHNGAHYYTIGQRKGLGVGGKAEPLFIVNIDTELNIVYAGQGEDHPALHRKGLFIHNSEIHWIREDLKLNVGESVRYMCRIRYRQALVSCLLYRQDEGLYLVFDETQRGIAKGQFAAWYDGEELIGSGVIS